MRRLSARRQGQIDETVSMIEKNGGTAIAVGCDITDAEQVRAIVEKTVAEFGRVDLLFNNAGSFNAIGAVWEVDAETWQKDMEVNLFGPMLCSQAVLQYMIPRDEGVIINMNAADRRIRLRVGRVMAVPRRGLCG